MKSMSNVSVIVLSLGITCIVNLAINVPFIYFTGVKMHMGPLSFISSIAFFASFYCLSKKGQTSIIISSAICVILLITVFDLPSSGSRNSVQAQNTSENLPNTAQQQTQTNQPINIPPEQKPMSSAASSTPSYEVDPAPEAKLHQTARQIYRKYPFLDGDNENANSKAMSAVSQTCADLVKRGMPLADALRIAASQVGPQYGPSDEKQRIKEQYGTAPLANVPIDTFCIMLSKPVPPYHPNK